MEPGSHLNPKVLQQHLVLQPLLHPASGGSAAKRIHLQHRTRGRQEFNSKIGKIPWRRKGNPLQYSYMENRDGQRSLAGYGPWGHRVGQDWAHCMGWIGGGLCAGSLLIPCGLPLLASPEKSLSPSEQLVSNQVAKGLFALDLLGEAASCRQGWANTFPSSRP